MSDHARTFTPSLLPRKPPAPSIAPRRLRIQVLSDLAHATSSSDVRPAPGVDVVAVAGDVTGCAVDTVRWLRERFPAPLPVVLVLGDQEFRGADQDCTLLRAKGVARSEGIVMLEDAQGPALESVRRDPASNRGNWRQPARGDRPGW